ncbi:MAG: glycosyltransferase [Acidobacteria bacterium]|nr:glycosyltransferase [Acidobacteriota bacterium]
MTSLHLTNAWHAKSGGIATYYRALLEAAEQDGRQMVLVVPGEQDSCERRQYTRLYTVAAPSTRMNPGYRVIYPNRWPGVHHRVAEIVRAEQPDLIEVCDKYCLHYLAGAIRRGLFPGLHKRPVLVGMSCERMDDNLAVYLTHSSWGQAFARWYMKWVYFAFFDHHVTVSHHTADELRIAARGHVRERGIWIRPNGVDLKRFSPQHRTAAEHARLAQAAGGNPDSRLVLYAGRLAKEKNLPLLLDTFERLLRQDFEHDYRLLIAGDGVERAALTQAAETRFPGYAHFLGHMAGREELAGLYANADVFVHTNPAEPFGIAPLEAMASGTPLVAPDRGGITSFAHSGNAWLAAPEAGVFTQAVLDTFQSPDREARRARALATAASLDWPVVARQFLDLYGQFVTAHGTVEPDFRSTPGTWLGSET